MAQSVKRPTLDFGSGHDANVMGLSPAPGSVLTEQTLLEMLSLPLSLCPAPAHAVACLSKINKPSKIILKNRLTAPNFPLGSKELSFGFLGFFLVVF